MAVEKVDVPKEQNLRSLHDALQELLSDGHDPFTIICTVYTIIGNCGLSNQKALEQLIIVAKDGVPMAYAALLVADYLQSGGEELVLENPDVDIFPPMRFQNLIGMTYTVQILREHFSLIAQVELKEADDA